MAATLRRRPALRQSRAAGLTAAPAVGHRVRRDEAPSLDPGHPSPQQREAEWRTIAQHLERADNLEEAERRILDSLDHLGVDSTLAHLHELRVSRLLPAGDHEGAMRAYEWPATGSSSARRARPAGARAPRTRAGATSV